MAGLMKRSVNVIMLGRMGFIPAFDIQSRYARQHLDEMSGKPNARGEDTLLLVEHNPVYTVGLRNRDYSMDDVDRLKATGAQFYTTNRGGLITFHGPGQLVAYPILNLTRFKTSMKWYVCQLEKTLVETMKPFGLTGRLTDQTGVWVGDRKIASIGLHGTRYVTTHGIALNCNSDLSWFKAIEPCGLKGVEMTSLSRELKTNVSYEDAAKPFLRAFQEVFNCDLEYRMLEKDDMKTLHDNNTHSTTNTAPATNTPDSTAVSSSNSNGNSSVSRLDQRAEIGIRQHSTLASSSPSAMTSTPSLTSSIIDSSSAIPSSTSVSFSSSSGSNRAATITPPIFKRTGPMW